MALAGLSVVRERKLWDLDNPRELSSQEQVDGQEDLLTLHGRQATWRSYLPTYEAGVPPPPASCICVSIKNLARGPGNHNPLLRQSSGYTCFASSCSSLSFQLISDTSHPLESVITSLLPVMVMNANSVQDILMDTVGAPACTRWGHLWLLWSKWAPRSRVIPFSLSCHLGRRISIEEQPLLDRSLGMWVG